MAYKKLKQ